MKIDGIKNNKYVYEKKARKKNFENVCDWKKVNK